MRILMWWGLGSLLFAGIWAYLGWRSYAELKALDEEWLAEQRRVEQTRGMDGVSWNWPIDKAANETAWRQTDRLRRRA